MKSLRHVPFGGRCSGTAFVTLLIALGIQTPAATFQNGPTSDRATTVTDAQKAAVQNFQKRLKDYVDLRTKLARELKPLAPTASASELAARQESLAAAIRTTRKTARKGDLIPTDVASLLRTVVADDFRARKPEARQAAFNEVTDGVPPTINRTYPANAALPTVPPLLLAKLPALPDNLQYRFLGRHLVLLDGDTQIIIDYVDNALPPH